MFRYVAAILVVELWRKHDEVKDVIEARIRNHVTTI
jgi:hypothetical protein